MTAWQLKGWHVLAAALSFFALIIGANVTMVTFALQTFSGAEETDAYRKGLEYNETLALKAAAAEAGWAAQVDVTRGNGGSAHVSVRLTRHGEAADDVTVMATLRHPSDAHQDRNVLLEPEGGGRYSGLIEGISSGSWDVVIDAGRGGETELETRLRTWLP
jgi:nitrogen fixation protein FixH